MHEDGKVSIEKGVITGRVSGTYVVEFLDVITYLRSQNEIRSRSKTVTVRSEIERLKILKPL